MTNEGLSGKRGEVHAIWKIGWPYGGHQIEFSDIGSFLYWDCFEPMIFIAHLKTAQVNYIPFFGKLKIQNGTCPLFPLGPSNEVCTKANRILGMIKKSFEDLDIHMVSKLFTTLIRPTLEYT